jgi:hypothetical protein
MVHLIVDLIGPLAQKGIEIGELPHSMNARVNLWRSLAWTFGSLSIAKEIVDKFGIRCAKERLFRRLDDSGTDAFFPEVDRACQARSMPFQWAC